MKMLKRYGKWAMLITVVPMLVFLLTIFCLKALQVSTFQKAIGISDFSKYRFGNEFQMYVDAYEILVDEHAESLNGREKRVKDGVFLNDFNRRTAKYGFGIIILDSTGSITNDTYFIADEAVKAFEETPQDIYDGVEATVLKSDYDDILIHCIGVDYEGEHYRYCLILDLDKANLTYANNDLANIIIALIVLFVTCIITLRLVFKDILSPLSMLQDVTDQIREGNLDVTLEYDARGEFGELCKNFDEMRKKLIENANEAMASEQEMREMITNISHDLKTPITTIKGYVEGLLDNMFAGNPEKQHKYLVTVFNKANDMDKLIDELTLYSKIGTNRATYNFIRLNAKAYFLDCAEELEVELDSRGIEFVLDDSLDEDVCIVADGEYLKRVINNLVSNSVKNMPAENGRIVMTLADEGMYVRVDMTDNGSGIMPKDLPHIFDRFYRGDASRGTKKGGSGVGLSIVKKIIDEHGGKIWVSSSVVGEGTTMSFVLKKSV